MRYPFYPPPTEAARLQPFGVDSDFLTEEYNKYLKRNEGDTDTLAEDFYEIADNYGGIGSVSRMQKLLDNKINADNVVEFLDSYENNKHGDTSIIDTIVSEVGASSAERKQALNTVMDNLIEAARNAGVSESDIKKAQEDFEKSMDKEFSALFRKINPNDMEKAVDFLRGAIAAKSVESQILPDNQISEDDAIEMFKSTFKEDSENAAKAFEDARKGEGWAAKAGDSVLGLFGCNTIEDMRAKLGDNAKNVEKLMNSKNDTEFKKNYKEIFGVEFDKNKIAARQSAIDKYQQAQSYSSAIQLSEEILKNSDKQSYAELRDELKSKFQYDDKTIDKIIRHKGSKLNLSTEEKKEVLVNYLKEIKENSNSKLKEIAGDKTIEQLKKDVDVLTQSALGTNNIAKDIAQFNENQELTGMAVEMGAEIAATIALQAIPGVGQAAAARLAVSAARWGAKGAKIASMANKAERGFSTLSTLQNGTNAGKIGSSMLTSGTATMAVDLSNGKSVEEALKRTLENMAFAGVGAGSNILAPKLMETFGIADSALAKEIAEELINAAGSYGITTLAGDDYDKQDAFMDFASGMIMARLAHVKGEKIDTTNMDKTSSYNNLYQDLRGAAEGSVIPNGKPVIIDSNSKITLPNNMEADLSKLSDGEYVINLFNGKIEPMPQHAILAEMFVQVSKHGDSVSVLHHSKNNDIKLGGASRNINGNNLDVITPGIKPAKGIENPNELCRNDGNNGNPIKKRYIQNSNDARQHLNSAIDNGNYLRSYQDYINTMNRAHQLAYSGISGNNLYKMDPHNNKQILIMNAGEWRTGGNLINGYPAKALLVENIAIKYNDPYRLANSGKLQLQGIDDQYLPENIQDKHLYPDSAGLDSYHKEMYRTANEALEMIKKGATQDEFLGKLAEHYQYAANARTYQQINNSLYMLEINTLLQRAGMKTMPHGILDHAAQRLQPENFKKYFIDEYKKTALNANPAGVSINSSISPFKDMRNVANDTPLKQGEAVIVNDNAKLNLAGQFEIDLTDSRIANLKEGEFVNVGRDVKRPNDIKVPASCSGVSRQHLQIVRNNGNLVVTDLSTNGTKISSAGSNINQRQINPPNSANAIQQSQKFNATHKIDINEVIMDGYKDGGRRLRFDTYGNPINKPSREIILVDRTKDTKLQSIVSDVKRQTQNMTDKQKADFLQSYIHNLCGDGGVAARNGNSWDKINKGNEVLIGDIVTHNPPVATCRHRSLLLKLLGDEIGLKVELQRGNFYSAGRGGGHAWNVVKFNDGTSAIYDSMHNKSSNITPGQVDNYAKNYKSVGNADLY